MPNCTLPVPSTKGFGVASVVIAVQVNMFKLVPVILQLDAGIVLLVPWLVLALIPPLGNTKGPVPLIGKEQE